MTEERGKFQSLDLSQRFDFDLLASADHPRTLCVNVCDSDGLHVRRVVREIAGRV